ncbi:hypothetical protein [Mucilaginibacter sp. 22184]|uniref:hypothetical protein n=1 Tax=Mucilaginibacter sp. 22184 TaxID=3453887 RepID=UPI003F8260AB
MINSISIHTTYQHTYQLQFNKQCWCIQEQYWRYLQKYRAGVYRKIIVEVDDNINLDDFDNKIRESTIDVIVINKYFPIAKFLNQSKIDRKVAILELLHASMLYLAQYFDWDKQPLVNSYTQCMDNHLEYKFKIKNKNFKSPTKEFIGYIECNWDIDVFSAYIIILLAKENKIIKERRIEFQPNLSEFIYYVNCKWESNTIFSMVAKDGRRWSVNILSLV